MIIIIVAIIIVTIIIIIIIIIIVTIIIVTIIIVTIIIVTIIIIIIKGRKKNRSAFRRFLSQYKMDNTRTFLDDCCYQYQCCYHMVNK